MPTYSLIRQDAWLFGAIETNATQQIAQGSKPSLTKRSRAVVEIEPIRTKSLCVLKSQGRGSSD